MMELAVLLSPLREAFNESANYLTWALYTLLTAYISLAFVELRLPARRKYKIAGTIAFALAMIITVVNIFFVAYVFYQKFGLVGFWLSLIFGLFILMVNSVPAINSLTKVTDNKSAQK